MHYISEMISVFIDKIMVAGCTRSENFFTYYFILFFYLTPNYKSTSAIF